jgi:hypothetical protein
MIKVKGVVYMYDYTYDIYPATEGIMSSFIGGIKKIIDEFAKWLSDAIKKIGNLIRNLFRKRKLPVNRPNSEHNAMQTCITNICTNVQDIFASCDNCISSIFQNLEVGASALKEKINSARDIFVDSFRNVDDKINVIQNDFFKLNSLHLSDSAIKEGYDSLRQIHDTNSKFGQTVKRAKDLHDLSEDTTVKPIIGKILKIYNYAVTATKNFGQKIITDIDHDLNDDDYFGLDIRKDDFDPSMDSVNAHSLTSLYNIAYESAMTGLVMKSECLT